MTPRSTEGLQLRCACHEDALCLAVLAMQVFLDTYATDGIRPALAREVLSSYSEQAFAKQLADPSQGLLVAELNGHLVGFAQLGFGASHELVPEGVQAELLRLYVQEPFTGSGVGSQLLARAEHAAAAQGVSVLWLSSWVHNLRARAFYQRRGYVDHGLLQFEFEGETHENRVYAKRLA